MKKIYTLGLALCLGGVFATGAAASNPAESDVYKVTMLLKEDFSKFTEGTQDAPAEAVMENSLGWLPVSATPTSDRWRGEQVHSAGGTAYIGFEGNLSGTLGTPDLRLSDADVARPLVVSLKAKKAPDDPEEHSRDWVYVALIDGSDGNQRQFQGNYGYVYDNEWNEHTYIFDFVRKPGATYFFIFYGYECGVYVDDIEVKYLDAYVQTPVGQGYSDFRKDGFTVNWSAVPGATGYELSLYTLNADRNKTRAYIHEDLKVDGTSYTFDGLDTNGKPFYYVVRACKDGKVSPESKPVKVEALTVPANLTASLTNDDVTLRWDAVPDTWYYEISTVREHKALADEDFVLARENLDAFGWTGTPLDPYRDLEDQYEFDGMVGMAGWISQYPMAIEGAVGLDGTMASAYGQSVYLQSPYYDFSISGGVVNLKADMMAIDEISGASYKPYVQLHNFLAEENKLVRADVQDIKGLSDEWTPVNVTLTGGTGVGVVEFCARGGWLYLDNIEISVPLKAGAEVAVPHLETTTKETSITLPITDLMRDNVLGYRIRAVKEVWDDYGFSRDYCVYSDYTPYTRLELSQAGVESVTAAASERADVYNLQGICVLRDASEADVRALPAGLYIHGNRKIAVK